MSWKEQLKGDALPWLLEENEPGVRYLVLRDLLDLPADDPELSAARTLAHRSGAIASVLEAMQPEGYWVKPGPGYNPKYHSTVWAMILLAQLGAVMGEDERIATACNYLLEHALTEYGQFTHSGAPSGTFDCLQGNLCGLLLDLGCNDPRLERAFEWMARSNSGQGMAARDDKSTALRYYMYKSAPNFTCGVNDDKPCAWGAVKVMLAFSKLPLEKRNPQINHAIQTGVDFLFSVDPATAAYPTRLGNDRPNRGWWMYSFPVFYSADLLQIVEALARLGYGRDPRLENARQRILAKQDEAGRWVLEEGRIGKTWVEFGPKKQPNKWVTYRALRALKWMSGA